jgi:16S rRNA (guanine527-N7)-methyltransferase
MSVEVQSLREPLTAGAHTLSLHISETQIGKLMAYVALLAKWNAVYNLTAVRDPQHMLTQHLLDCMAALPAYSGARRVLDVGSGGGLPGIVLAIWAQQAEPGMTVHMIDTVHKKTAFLTQVKAELDLHNARIHTGRVEHLHVDTPFEVITSRAFAELKDFVNGSGHLLAAGGKMIALKGQSEVSDKELAALPTGWVLDKRERLTVPGLAAERHLVHLRRQPA